MIPAGPSSASGISDRIAAEPACRQVLHRLLEFCCVPRSRSDICDWMRGLPEMRSALQEPEVLLAWMIQAGALALHGGDASRECWQTTEAGRTAVEINDPGRRLQALLTAEPAYEGIYRQVLQFCTTARSVADIEGLLRANPVLENPKVYPSYLVDRLESAGGIAWNGNWETTGAGKHFLES